MENFSTRARKSLRSLLLTLCAASSLLLLVVVVQAQQIALPAQLGSKCVPHALSALHNTVSAYDVNCDGDVNNKDYTAAIVYVSVPANMKQKYPYLPDVNCNGTADAADWTEIFNVVFLKKPRKAFACPVPVPATAPVSVAQPASTPALCATVPDYPLHNATNNNDVNCDGLVTEADPKALSDYINARVKPTGVYPDVNCDGVVTPVEVLGIINDINSGKTGAANRPCDGVKPATAPVSVAQPASTPALCATVPDYPLHNATNNNDVNCDGSVNADDHSEALKYVNALMSGRTPAKNVYPDVDCDGAVQAQDVSAVANAINNGQTGAANRPCDGVVSAASDAPAQRPAAGAASAASSSAAAVRPVCGDAACQASAGEQCDDGNASNGDGCSVTCRKEQGFHCSTCTANGRTACTSDCGNGTLNTDETCDDTNRTPGDGCSSFCKTEAGWICPFAGQVCTRCGNGAKDSGETCDDINRRADDGCSASCQTEAGWECPTVGASCRRICSNGTIQSGEQCDDKNSASGDGCSSTCQQETGWECTTVGSPCNKICSNGALNSGETCDDKNITGGDGCSSTCQKETGWICPTVGQACTQCGNGSINAGETCDDSDNPPEGGDGCSAICALESGWECPTVGSPCRRICSNGTINVNETCDDKNITGGDGCSSTCQKETGWECPTVGAPCRRICSNGTINVNETCDDKNITGGDGCSSTCQKETGWECPTVGSPCRRIASSSSSAATLPPTALPNSSTCKISGTKWDCFFKSPNIPVAQSVADSWVLSVQATATVAGREAACDAFDPCPAGYRIAYTTGTAENNSAFNYAVNSSGVAQINVKCNTIPTPYCYATGRCFKYNAQCIWK